MAVFCSVFFHGYEVFQYTLSIDEELMLGGVSPLEYVQRGRWGGIVLWWLRVPLPVTSMVAGLVLYTAAFVLLIRQFEIKNWELVIVASGIFFGFPVLLHAFAFSNVTLTIGLGALVAVSALYVARVRNAWRLFLAALLIAFSVSLYQSFFYFVIVIFFADVTRRMWVENSTDVRDPWTRLVWYGAIVAIGLLLYGFTELFFSRYSANSSNTFRVMLGLSASRSIRLQYSKKVHSRRGNCIAGPLQRSSDFTGSIDCSSCSA